MYIYAAQRITEKPPQPRHQEEDMNSLNSTYLWFMRALATSVLALALSMAFSTIFPIKEFFGAILIPAFAKWLGLPPPTGRLY